MRALVTGATGLVGNNVVRLLLAQGHEVRVLTRAKSDERPFADLKVEKALGDVRDLASLRAATDGMTHVIHAAAFVHIGWSELDTQRAINVEGTRHVAIAAREAGARMVHVSSVDALGVGKRNAPATEDSPREGKTPCSYVVSKREAEAVLREEIERGTAATIVNPTLMFGPWDWKPSSGRMIVEVVKLKPPLTPAGGGNTVDVRDVAAGIVAAAERGAVGRNYILGGENLTYFDLWTLIAEVAGNRAPRLRMGPLLRGAVGSVGDIWGKLRGREPMWNSAALKMAGLYHFYSSERAAKELGYTARPVREAVSDALVWFREHKYL